MKNELEAQLSRIGLGDHLCLMYQESGEALDAAALFLREGLEQGGHAIYVIDDHTLDRVVEALEGAGIDVEAERERGALRFLTAAEYCPPGEFEPQRMLARFRSLGDEVAAARVPLVRAAVEMTWALTAGAPLDLLAEYECWGNNIFEHVSGASLCMYNQRRFPPDAMERLLRAHPIVVLGNEVAPNPFFEPPEVYFGGSEDPTLRFQWMLRQLQRARADRQEREELSRQAHALEAEREARAAAEALNQAKSRFMAVLSHELRTPLSAVIGYAELLSQEVVGPLTDGQRIHLGRIRASSRHLVELIDELLELSRVEAGGVELRLERFDAAELAREALALVEPQAGERGLELIPRIPAESVPVRTDPGRVRQILLNLLGNAIKYTETGHVELEIDCAGGTLVFRVSDTGVGIESSELEQIFEAFHRAGSSPVRGAGLGLAVSRSLARLLGGDVTAESTPGEGSTFTLSLPVPVGADLQTA